MTAPNSLLTTLGNTCKNIQQVGWPSQLEGSANKFTSSRTSIRKEEGREEKWTEADWPVSAMSYILPFFLLLLLLRAHIFLGFNPFAPWSDAFHTQDTSKQVPRDILSLTSLPPPLSTESRWLVGCHSEWHFVMARKQIRKDLKENFLVRRTNYIWFSFTWKKQRVLPTSFIVTYQ